MCHDSLRHSLNLLTFVLEITPLTALSLPARIDKIAWQQKLRLMHCDHATLPASSQLPLSQPTTDLRLGCECVGKFIRVVVCGYVYPKNLLDFSVLFVYPCKRKWKRRRKGMKVTNLKRTKNVEIETF